ncbi:BPM1 [Symbiodinium sp. KB8]|nr:BPM1 [Symbiodinium sp. KB8]
MDPQSMSAEELEAEIEATRRRVEAERTRRRELRAETQQAGERRRLRKELQTMREALEAEQAGCEHEEWVRRVFDEDRVYDDGPLRFPLEPYGSRVSRSPVMQASEGTSAKCADRVARGEHVWRIEGFSWLKSMLKQEDDPFFCVTSRPILLGYETFHLAYSPWAGELCEDYHGSLAILLRTTEWVGIRYRIYIKMRNGEFQQWGETCDVVHRGDPWNCAYGPDVHWPGDPPPSPGIFGLSHEELLQSEWVQNDTLTVKLELEVRPDAFAEPQVLSLATEIPESTIVQDTQALFEEGTCSDVRFMVQDEVIHAHSQVLCARSEVFGKQLTAGMQESVSKVITIEDCDAATFKAFLRFLYTDRLPDTRESQQLDPGSSRDTETEGGLPQLPEIQALLAVSHRYQVKRLHLWCEAKISEHINSSQVCGILCQAHLLQAKQLERACLSFIKAHAGQVLTLPAYVELVKKWPEIGVKVSLFSAGVSEAEALAAMDAVEKPQDQKSEQAAGSYP